MMKNYIFEVAKSRLLKSTFEKGYLKTYCFFAILFFSITCLNAQTTIINPATDGGFNSGATFAANGWTTANDGTGLVKWEVGTAVNSGAIAGNSAYVSLDGGASNAYVGLSTGRTIYFYKDVAIPAGETNIALSFDFKSAVNSWQVFVAPTTVTPVGTDAVTNTATGSLPLTYPLTGATPINLGLVSTTTSKSTGFIPASFAGQTVRLIFMWTNGTGGTNPPLAIDNISLVSRVGGQTVSSIATGDYTNPTTWDTGYVPSPTDDVVINSGHTVTINSRMLKCENLYIAGANAVMQFNANSEIFTINNDLVINGSGARFNVYEGTNGKAIEVGHDISLGSGGRLDVSVGSSSNGVGSLILNGSSLQTVSSDGTGLIGGTVVSTTTTNTSNIFNQLIISNTSSAIPNIDWQLNNVRIKNAFKISNAKIALGTNKFIIGNFANMSSSNFVCSNNSGFVSGIVSRWYGTSAVGTAINPGVDYNPNSAALFPLLTSSGSNRWAFIVTPAASTAGEIEVAYTNATTMTTGLSVLDGSTTITDRYDGNWTITKNGSGGTIYNITTGTISLGLYANGAFVANDGNSRIMNALTVATGTHINGTPTPFAVRSGIALADLITSPYYIGANSTSILGGTTKTSAATGDWNTASTWIPSGVPTCTDVVTIASGHTVTNSSTSSASSVLINAGGTLVNAASTLTVGCTNNNSFLINNGTLTVSGGELKVNGSVTHASGSTFNQSGGDIIVDSNNNGDAATSVGQGGTSFKIETSNLNLSAGKITIVDPLINNTVATTSLTGSSFDINTLGAAGTFQKATNALASTGTTTIVMNGFNSNQNIYGIGQAISGTGIAPGTTIVTVTAGPILNQPITLTISQPTIADIPAATSLDFSSMNNGSFVLDFPNTGDFLNLAIGQGVSGTGIQPGTTIVSLASDLAGIGGVRISLPVAGLPTSPITSPATVTFSAMTEGSTVVILAAANPAILVGQTVGGTGIQPATTVSAIAGVKLTLSQPALGVSPTPVTLSFYDGNLSSYAFSYNSSTHYAAGINHTLQFGDGISTEKAAVTTNGFMTNFIVGTGLFSTGNLKIDALDGANRFFNTINAIHVQNNFEVTAGSVYKKTVSNGISYFSGNITNNGTMYCHVNSQIKFMNYVNGVETATTNAQTISGSGLFYNDIIPSLAYASFTSTALNNANSNGLTISTPNFRVSSITMIDGIIFTSDATPLYVGRADLTQNGSITGTNFGTTCHIDGPVVRGNALTFTTATYLLTPLGKDGQYSPISLAVAGGAMFKLEAFNTNAGSTSSNAANLSTKRWKATREGTLGALTNYRVRLGNSSLATENIVLQSTTDEGAYDITTSVSAFISGTPNTIQTDSDLVGSGYSGYFAYGTVPNCATVAPGNTIADYSITQVVYSQNSSSSGIMAGSANVTLQANANSLIVPGLYVSGAGIPSGTTLVSVTGTALVLSQPATVTSVSQTSLTFTSITTPTSICGFQSVTLKLQNEAVGAGVTYQWQSSVDEVTYSNVSGATNKTLTVTPLGETYYQCIVTCPFGPVTATSTPVMVQFSNELTSTAGGSTCTASTPIALSAVATSGTINWYDVQTGGTPLATGATYSPSPATTTTYYVASEEMGTAYSAGRSFTGTLTQQSNYSGIVFNATKNLLINTVKVHPKQTAAAADAGAPITIRLYDSNGNIVPGTLPVTFTPVTNTGAISATINNVVTLNYNVPAGSGYKLLATSGLSNTNTLGRLTTANTPIGVGSFNILGSVSTLDGAMDTSNVNFFDISVTDVCSTPRVAVLATVSSNPDVPTVSTTAATCSADGSSTITNYDSLLTYTFLPTGPSVGTGGAISGATAGTSYTVSASNATCTSVTASFTNAVMLVTPSTPTVSTTAATCSADGSSTITNYDSLLTYTFLPTGPSVGTGGAISGATAGTSYTVSASNATCTSSTASFTNAVMLVTPSTPTISTTAATCSADGSSTITNYDSLLTYAFLPTGPSVGTGGVISGATAGTSYTVSASNATCTSATASFTNAVMLVTPSTPTVSTTAATCSADGSSTITNYDSLLTYTFLPTGPSVGTGGVISGATAGTSYTVSASNATCTSATASFTNAVMLANPTSPTGDAVQTISVVNASEATIEDLVISNSTGIWYPTSADAIAGTNAITAGTVLVSGTTYYAINSNTNCSSAPFGVTVTVTLGNENFELNNLKYYPNPVSDVLRIVSQEVISGIEIYNMIGQKVITLEPNALQVEVNFSELPTATYLVKVLSNEKTKTLNILKK